SEAGNEVGSARCLMKPLTTARRRAGGDGVISCSEAVRSQCRPLSSTATRHAAIEQSAYAIAIVSAGRYQYVTAAAAVMTAAAGGSQAKEAMAPGRPIRVNGTRNLTSGRHRRIPADVATCI